MNLLILLLSVVALVIWPLPTIVCFITVAFIGGVIKILPR